jgi:ribonuclease HI
MAAKKYYAVAAGRSCGIYPDWPTAEKQVKGYPGAKFKSFTSRQLAEDWLCDPVYSRKTGQKDPVFSSHPAVDIPPGAVVVYTDGGCINNPGPGGYGVVILAMDRTFELSGGYRLTTNNRMEVMAAIVGLKKAIAYGAPIFLFSDSSYLVNAVNKGWAKSWRKNDWMKSDGQPPLNIDLWKQLLALIEGDGPKVRFHWVKGHSGNPLNERCDQLAVAAARSDSVERDRGYEKINEW